MGGLNCMQASNALKRTLQTIWVVTTLYCLWFCSLSGEVLYSIWSMRERGAHNLLAVNNVMFSLVVKLLRPLHSCTYVVFTTSE